MVTLRITGSSGWIFAFNALHPTLKVTCEGKDATIRIPHLSSAQNEEEYRWYFEDYVEKDSFLISRATRAFVELEKYGTKLAEAILTSGFISPDVLEEGLAIWLEENLSKRTGLHHIHWEILEWTDLWPLDHRPKFVTVTRSFISNGLAQSDREISRPFRVLVLAARPGSQDDVPHRLVSRIVQNVADYVQLNSGASLYQDVKMDIVNPGTFESLKECLDKRHNYYDVVHLDVHGHQIGKQYGQPPPPPPPFLGPTLTVTGLFLPSSQLRAKSQ